MRITCMHDFSTALRTNTLIALSPYLLAVELYENLGMKM